MELPVLKDPQLFPSDEVLISVLHESFPAYASLMKSISEPEFSIEPQWNYYKDGNAWLCKNIFKKKTVFWLSVFDRYFKVAFYFTEKTAPFILELDIDPAIKESFTSGKAIGKLLPLVVDVRNSDPLGDVLKIAEVKMKK